MSVTLRMSVSLWTSGQCLRRIALQNLLFSHWYAILNPAFWKPRSNPPIPEKNDATENKRWAVPFIRTRPLFAAVFLRVVTDPLLRIPI